MPVLYFIYLFIYLFNTFGAPSTYKIQSKSYDKIILNSTAITGHKTPLTWHRNVLQTTTLFLFATMCCLWQTSSNQGCDLVFRFLLPDSIFL